MNTYQKKSKDIYDVIVIGGGPAGVSCAVECKRRGLSVLLIEKKKLGGVCTNVGCIPTKTLKASCEVLQIAREGKYHGIDLDIKNIDTNRFIERAKEVAAEASKQLEDYCNQYNVEIIYGSAKIISKESVEVDQKIFRCRNLVIATGTRPRKLRNISKPDIENMIIYPDEFWSLKEFPKSVVILGGGVIGSEFASLCTTLGITTYVIDTHERILSALDPLASDFLTNSLTTRGCTILTSVKESAITPEGVVVNGTLYRAEKVIVAIGREFVFPEGIENLGLEKNPNGAIKTNEYLETNIPGVYAIGDIANGMYAHVATAHGKHVARLIAGHRDKFKIVTPFVIYTYPEIAATGIKKIEPTDKILFAEFKENSRAMVEARTNGVVEVILDKHGHVKSAIIIGHYAGELISYLCLAILNKLSFRDLCKHQFPHPTYSEIFNSLEKYIKD